MSGFAALPYVPGLNNSAYRSDPNSLSTCRVAIASTAAWIWLCGIDGSKIRTFGPKSGKADGFAFGAAACTDGATARRAMTARLATATRRLRLGRERRRDPPDAAFDHVVIASPLL